MRKITFIACLLAAVVAFAQFTEPGFYRIHNVGSDRYICIRGTHYNRTSNPDAFWPCIKMLNDSDQLADPGSIVYIPEMGKTSLCAQGVSTYSLTGLLLEIDTATVREGGLATYVAKTQYGTFPCIFRDAGKGLTAGYLEQPASRWWVEPVNAGSIDTSYLAVKPVNGLVADDYGWYWATMCCDFSFVLPLEGNVEGAYTVQEVALSEDNLYHATPVKVYGQGDTVPAAMPVLLRCKAAYASGNRIIPVAPIANQTQMPIVNDLLMGNYFSNFINHASLTDMTVMAEYIPQQATKAAPQHLALGVNADGKLGFFPQDDATFMAANSAWLCLDLLDQGKDAMTAVYLDVTEPEMADPEIPEPEVMTGDINGDGKITIRDVTDLIHFILYSNVEEEEPSRNVAAEDAIDMSASDLNGDGVITIRDLTLLINMLLTHIEE